ncbi:hypothetical protein D7X99_32725 [Corallococcus sp. AB032C]|nr:hypothetical protein D7X99_32725 [Corallococcus sp. AB032C]
MENDEASGFNQAPCNGINQANRVQRRWIFLPAVSAQSEACTVVLWQGFNLDASWIQIDAFYDDLERFFQDFQKSGMPLTT